MPEKSGFFDSTADDIRAYPARDFAEYFARLLTNGVFNGGTNLEVTATGNDANVRLNVGYAWINGYVYSVYDSPIVLSIEPASTMDRIDRVVLRLDTSIPIRAIRAIILQGAPNTSPTPPSLVRSGNIYDISLAQIRVKANSTIVEKSNITDERLDQNVCGLVNSLIRVDTATFQRQWDDFIKSIQDHGFATAEYVRNYVDSKPWQKHKVSADDGAAVDISGLDLNNILYTGFYKGSSMGNAPFLSASWGYVEVIRHAETWVLQKVYDLHADRFYMRRRTDGGWTAWTQDLFTSVANGKNDIAAAIRDKGQNAQGSDSFQQLANAIRQIGMGGRILLSPIYKNTPLTSGDGNTWTYFDIVTIPSSQNFVDVFPTGSNMQTNISVRCVTADTGWQKWASLVLIDEAGVIYTIKAEPHNSGYPVVAINALSIDRNQRKAIVYITSNGQLVGETHVAFPANMNLHGRIRLCGAAKYLGSDVVPNLEVYTKELIVVTT